MLRLFFLFTVASAALQATALAQPVPDGAGQWTPPPPNPGDVRGLPPCPEGTPPAEPGEQYACRPEMAEPGLQMALPIELAWGGMHAGTPLQHSAISFAAGLDVGLSRAVSLGARWRYLGGGEAVGDGNDDGNDDVETGYYGSHLVGAGPRLRLWTDETAREAWMLELDGGWSFVPGHPELAGPYARFSVGRQVGLWLGQTAAAQAALVLSYLKGFAGAEDLHALLVGIRLHPEWGVPLPRDVGEVPGPASFAYTLGVQGGLFGLQLGDDGGPAMIPSLGLTFGLPITRALEPRILADMSWFGSVRQTPSPLAFAGLAGLRLRMSEYLPMFFDAMGGWQVVTDVEPRPHDGGPVVDLATGVYFAGCPLAASVGVRYRQGLAPSNEEYRALSMFFEVSYGSRRGALGGEPMPAAPEDWACGGGYHAGRAATPPPPPPEPEPEPMPDAGGRVDVGVPEVEARAEIDVEVEVEPIVVEVTLGASLFGGAVRLEVSPGSLPIRQLRESGFVHVELIGPADALARAQGEVRAALGPDAASVDAWASSVTDDVQVRARFTLWPPGARPPAP